MTDKKNPALNALMNYQQADMDGVMVTVSRQAIHEVADQLAAAEARVKELEGALIPFAEDRFARFLETTTLSDCHTVPINVTVRAMKTAVKALNDKGGEDE